MTTETREAGSESWGEVTTSATGQSLPRRALESFFPGLESPQLRAALDDVARGITDFETLFNRYAIGGSREGTAAAVAAFNEVVARYHAELEWRFSSMATLAV